jgi:hypothetical protein
VPGGSDPSGTEDPITAEVPDQMKKHKKSDILIVVVALGSSLGLLLTCAVVLILLVRWKKLGRLHEDMNPATTPEVNRRYGMVFNSITFVGTYRMQTTFWCKPYENLLKKF